MSHDYCVPDGDGRFDYSGDFERINRTCDEHGCDTVLYALFTWDRRSPRPRTHESIFGGLTHVRRVVLEVGVPHEVADRVEVWRRGEDTPLVAYQRFATSSVPSLPDCRLAFSNSIRHTHSSLSGPTC